MSASGSIVPLNVRPQRFSGRIHETVRSIDDDGKEIKVTIVGGSSPEETISLMLHSGMAGAFAELAPDAAIRLGQLLVAAGRDANEGIKSCEFETCADPPVTGEVFCATHIENGHES